MNKRPWRVEYWDPSSYPAARWRVSGTFATKEAADQRKNELVATAPTLTYRVEKLVTFEAKR